MINLHVCQSAKLTIGEKGTLHTLIIFVKLRDKERMLFKIFKTVKMYTCVG